MSGRLRNANPFCTRFVQPGAIEFHFASDQDGHESNGPTSTIVDQLVAKRFALVVGPHGSGKSTLLQTLLPELQRRFAKVVSVRTHACPSNGLSSRLTHRRQLALRLRQHQNRLDERGLLIVDGIEQLTIPSRLGLLHTAKRKSQTVLGTSHRRLRSFATIFETKVNARLIETLTESLLLDTPGNLSNPVLAELRSRDLTKLCDVRELWFDLYDFTETLRERQPR